MEREFDDELRAGHIVAHRIRRALSSLEKSLTSYPASKNMIVRVVPATKSSCTKRVGSTSSRQ
eukprot:scaffold1390_cov172-Amphora_coffeaeformis.AAC.2